MKLNGTMIYRFDSFTLEKNKRRLSQNGDDIPLSSKAFDVLLYLVENKVNIVSKNELLSNIWPDSFVEEANLYVHISALRKIFKERANRNLIKTIPGSGYIFTEDIEKITEPVTDVSAQHSQQNRSKSMSVYLEGKYIIETVSTRIDFESDLYQAISYFERAIKLDPNFVDAYIGIGRSIQFLNNYGYLSKLESQRRSEIILRQASLIDPENSEVFCLEGIKNIAYDFDLRKSLISFERSVQIDPTNAEAYHWLAVASMLLGEFEDAYIYQKESVRLNPMSIPYRNTLIRIYYHSNKFNDAISEANEVLRIEGRSFPATYLLSSCYAELGLYDEALRYIQKSKLLYDNYETDLKRAYILALRGEDVISKGLVDQFVCDGQALIEDVASLAAVYSASGNIAKAFDLMFENWDRANWGILTLKVDPCFNRLRHHENYEILLKELKLL